MIDPLTATDPEPWQETSPQVERIGVASGGYAVESEGRIYVPVVLMPRPGMGDGGRFLDALPGDRTIVFPCVVSAVLAGMLERRGFVLTWEWSEQYQEALECYIRFPTRRPTRPL